MTDNASLWDWNIVIGAGQSLSVGAMPIESDQPLAGHFKVDSEGLTYPLETDLQLAPLCEPAGGLADTYPSSWPRNVYGETPHTAMAQQISALCESERLDAPVTVHFPVGESGQGMIYLRREPEPHEINGRAYAASLAVTQRIVALAKQEGKTCGVAAIILTHGESDAGNPNYGDELRHLAEDYNRDLQALTGQTRNVLMIVSQHNQLNEFSPSTIAQWRTPFDHPELLVCSGPKYQYPYSQDGVHMPPNGYRQVGEKYGQVFFERVVKGNPWRPLEPVAVTVQDRKIVILFHVPIGPLRWDDTLGDPHPSTPQWANGKGFELSDADGKRLEIVSAEITAENQVTLLVAEPIAPGTRLSYALVGEITKKNPEYGAIPHWGLLRDSDPFIGVGTGVPNPNFCVAFEWWLG